jgi:hypothetical protein
MKNVFKIPNLNPRKGFKPLRGLIVALLLPLVGSFSACSLADALKPTPQIDQYGLDKNATFACLVNGQKWEPAGSTTFSPSTSALYEAYTDSSLAIGSYNNLKKQNFGFYIKPLKVSKFVIGQNSPNTKEFWLTFIDESKYPYGQDSKIPKAFEGFINITSFIPLAGSTAVKTLKGTFEFKTLDYKGDTLKITAGRFNYGN